MADLSEYEIGVLRSTMSTGSAAMILGRSARWVEERRNLLTMQAAQEEAARSIIEGVAADPHPFEGLVCTIPAAESVIAQNPEPAPARKSAAGETTWSPKVDDPAQIDLEEAIAQATPIGPHGAPGHLTGEPLAAWLYDNTGLTFDGIAAAAGVSLERVQALADGESDENSAVVVVMTADHAKVFEDAPGDTAYVAAADTGARDLYTLTALTQLPATIRAISVVAFAEKTDATTRTLHNTVKEPVTFAERQPRTSGPEIPAKVVRWARWFIDARWSYKDVAYLFDVPKPALRSALRPLAA